MEPHAPPEESRPSRRGPWIVWMFAAIIPNGVVGLFLGMDMATNIHSLDSWAPTSFTYMALFLQLASSIWLGGSMRKGRREMVVSILVLVLFSLAISGVS